MTDWHLQGDAKVFPPPDELLLGILFACLICSAISAVAVNVFVQAPECYVCLQPMTSV